MKKLLIIAAIVAAWYWFKNRKPASVATEQADPYLKSAWLLTTAPIMNPTVPVAPSTISTPSGAEIVSYDAGDPGQTDASGSYTPPSYHVYAKPTPYQEPLPSTYFNGSLKSQSCFR